MLTLVTPPTTEPLSIASIKAYLRIDHDDEDLLLGVLRDSARAHAEHETGRVFMEQTWDYVLDRFPSGDIRIPIAPLKSVQHISYWPIDGSPQVVLSADHYVIMRDLPRPRIVLAPQKAWPDTTERVDAVTVRFVAGYGTTEDDVPAAIRQWMLLRVAALYEYREAISSGQIHPLPRSHVDGLLDPYRVVEAG